MVTCEGGVGEEKWYTVVFGDSKVYVGTDSSATVYQSSGQLLVGDFQSFQTVSIFCEDEVLSTVFTTLTEGALNYSSNIAPTNLDAIASYTTHAGVVITSATASSTSITVFWEPHSPNMNRDRQASCCKVEQPGMCSNNNEVRISNGNFSVDGLEEFTNYSCRIARFSAPFVATTLGDSKFVHALRQAGTLSQCLYLHVTNAYFSYAANTYVCSAKCPLYIYPTMQYIHVHVVLIPAPLNSHSLDSPTSNAALRPSPPEPSSPPDGVQLVPVNPTSLRLMWGLPPELGRNGIITQYIVECMEIASVQSPVILTLPTFDTPTTIQQLLTGLTFLTSYSCRVAAANVNGTGPFSAWVTATTPQGCELVQLPLVQLIVHGGFEFLYIPPGSIQCRGLSLLSTPHKCQMKLFVSVGVLLKNSMDYSSSMS